MWTRLCFDDIWEVVNMNSCSFWHRDSNNRCGYPAVNASYYDLSFHPVNSNHDCKVYKNSKAVKCYDCDSCKYITSNLSLPFSIHQCRPCENFHHYLIVWSFRAGVAQYMKTEWRLVAIFNVILFVVLVRHFSSKTSLSFHLPPCISYLLYLQLIIYLVGCCARRKAARNRSKG